MFETMPSLTLSFSIKNSTCRRVGFVKVIAPRLFLFLCMALIPVDAVADECTRAHSVVFKQKSPCAGLLVPASQAHEVLKCEVEKLPKCMLGRDVDKKKCDARIKALEESFAIERARAERLQSLLDAATSVAPPETPWWKHPVLWTTVGLAVGAAGMYAYLKASEG